MSKSDKLQEFLPDNSRKRSQHTTGSSRRDFLKTAGVTAGAVMMGESLWAAGSPMPVTNFKFAFPKINQQLMITPAQALEWATFKAKCGPTWAGSAGWKQFTDFLI